MARQTPSWPRRTSLPVSGSVSSGNGAPISNTDTRQTTSWHPSPCRAQRPCMSQRSSHPLPSPFPRLFVSLWPQLMPVPRPLSKPEASPARSFQSFDPASRPSLSFSFLPYAVIFFHCNCTTLSKRPAVRQASVAHSNTTWFGSTPSRFIASKSSKASTCRPLAANAAMAVP